MSKDTISRQAILRWIENYAETIHAQRDYLTELDAAIGDADHGANMDRGFKAVLAKLPSLTDEDIGVIMKTVGMTLLSSVGGAGGPLFGTIFLQAAQIGAGKIELTLADWVAVLEGAAIGVTNRGKAALGDKTMLDALLPAVQALKDAASSGADIPSALNICSQAAELGMQNTLPLVARKGRASYLGERSSGHIDPGATSIYYLLRSAAETLADG